MPAFVLSFLLIISCAGDEKSYTGSTPANGIIKSFLDIPKTDSVDFIRWKLKIHDNQYELECNYGIGKPNTSGFINGGKIMKLGGECRKEKNRYLFQNHTKTLKAVELNADLLHLLGKEDELLRGNGGWSYTLNSTIPSGTDSVSITAKPTIIKDSIAFEGRTPCNVPGVITSGDCHKLKWYIVLYAGTQTNEGTYRITGTAWRREEERQGKWKVTTGKNGKVIYRLYHNNEKGFFSLLKPSETVLLFTDTEGNLLTGNEDFSYTLNRKW